MQHRLLFDMDTFPFGSVSLVAGVIMFIMTSSALVSQQFVVHVPVIFSLTWSVCRWFGSLRGSQMKTYLCELVDSFLLISDSQEMASSNDNYVSNSRYDGGRCIPAGPWDGPDLFLGYKERKRVVSRLGGWRLMAGPGLSLTPKGFGVETGLERNGWE